VQDDKVTEAGAQQVLDAVIQRYRLYFQPIRNDDGSVLVEGDEKPFLLQDEGGNWEVVWEDGPYEWAYRFTMGGVNEEVAVELHQEFGATKAEAGKRATEEAVALPARLTAQVSVEPATSYSLGIYPA
jgi:hypothetical protein